MDQPKIWDYVLGATAEVNTISNDVIDESSGSPTFKGLYPEITGIPVANGGIPVKRKDINALFKLIGEQIYFIQRGGIYKWDYNVTYPKGAIVSHNDVLYRAKAESTSRDPEIDTNSWSPLIEVTKEDLENIEVNDGSILEKGIVQLTNEVSDDETMAVTPKAVKGLLDQLNLLVSQVGALESTATTLSGNISQNTTDISALQAKDTSIESEIDELRALIGDGSEIDLSGIQSQIDAIVEVNNQQNSAIEALQEAGGGNYDEEITALQASDTNQNGQIAELTSKVSTAESNISTVESSVTDLNNALNTNTTNISDLQSRVSNLEGQSADGLQEQIDNAVNRITSLEELYEENDLIGIYNYDESIPYDAGSIVLYNNILYKAIVDSQGNLPTNASFFEVYDPNPTLTQNVSTIEGNVSANTTSISSLNTRVENAETRISALENADESDADLTEITQRISDAENDISDIQTDLQTTNSNVSALDTRVTALENSGTGGDTSALETRLTTAETNISSLQTADVTLSDRITTLENAEEPDISALESRVQTLETGITNKADETDLQSTNSNVTALDTRVTALETDIADKANSSDLQTTNSNVSTNASDITSLKTRVTALENAPSGGSGGVSYQFFSLDMNGDVDDDAGLDEAEAYVTYQAESRDAVTAISISGTTTTININHAKDIRKMRIMIPSEALGNPTANYDNPIRIILKYDDANPETNMYDVWKTNYIYPTAQAWLDGNLAKGSVQGNSSYMEVTKLWWNVDSNGCPMLYVSFANQLAQPVCVILNF